VGVVLLHSGITDPRQWERELAEWPFDCTAPDLHDGFELLEPSVLVGNSFGERLGEIRAPVMLVDGELDQPDFHRISDRLERELPDVRGRVTIAGAHHLPSLERPAEFDAAVLPFLRQNA
jgi:pimeloyl-ACP methyl ester carboxylesterase